MNGAIKSVKAYNLLREWEGNPIVRNTTGTPTINRTLLTVEQAEAKAVELLLNAKTEGDKLIAEATAKAERMAEQAHETGVKLIERAKEGEARTIEQAKLSAQKEGEAMARNLSKMQETMKVLGKVPLSDEMRKMMMEMLEA